MELNRPVAEVEAVINFYYKTVRSTLSSMVHPVVQVENLGNFYIKEKALDQTILYDERFLQKLSNVTMKEYGLKQKLKNELELLQTMKEKLNMERLRRRAVIDKRFNNVPEN